MIRSPRRVVVPLVSIAIALAAVGLVACSSSGDADPDADGGDGMAGGSATAAEADGGGGSSGAAGAGDGGAGVGLTDEECAARFDHPCRRADVDAAALEAQARIASEVATRSVAESREAAFDWVRQQPEVVESQLSGTVLMFRVEGALPTSIITPISEPPPGLLDSAPAGVSNGASGSESGGVPTGSGGGSELILSRSGAVDAHPRATGGRRFVVVGTGTDRANPQNQKQALFLEPWGSSEGSIFGAAGRVEPRELFGAIADYADVNSVVHVLDASADPLWFTSETWRQYDFIYVSTHSGTWADGAVVESGVREAWDGEQATYDEICNRLLEPYWDLTGLECGVQQLTDEQYITVDMTFAFFEAQYADPGRRLDRAVVYIEGCETLKFGALGRTIVSETSAYLGWTDYISLTAARHASGQLLVQMTKRKRNVQAAMVTLCELDQCGGPAFRDRTSSGGDPFLRVLNNSDEALRLRLYDVPVVRDPRQPTSIGPGLQDGAELQSLGAAGDGVPDQLDIAVELTGVVEQPESASGAEFANVALRQEGGVPDQYFLQVYVNDEQVGLDNLGRALRGEPADRTAVATQVDEETYRYVFTADLPFDVDPEGTEATIRVVVPLPSPEEGESTYEVQVRVLPGAAGATITIGGEVFEFELFEFAGVVCQLSPDDEEGFLSASGFVEGNPSGTSFSANIDPDGSDAEGLFSVHGITVTTDDGREFMADDLEFPMLQWLEEIPPGGSQIDEVTIDRAGARGTATFYDVLAAQEAWLNNGAAPSPVSGSFDIRCG